MSRWPGEADRDSTTFGNLSRSALMRRIPSHGNKTTEKRLASAFRRYRITGWRRHMKLPGTPDFAFQRERVAVFVDGCFWHGHSCRNLVPEKNAALWAEKIRRNARRDRATDAALASKGWRVVRIWECELQADLEGAVRAVQLALSQDR